MQYTVVHSTDPYLLARLATDLQMSKGFDCSDFINQPQWNPFEIKEIKWEVIYPTGQTFFLRIEPKDPPFNTKPIKLTSRNYIKILTKILEP